MTKRNRISCSHCGQVLLPTGRCKNASCKHNQILDGQDVEDESIREIIKTARGQEGRTPSRFLHPRNNRNRGTQ